MVGHSPVFQILLQIEVRMSITASPPAWTNSAGMISTPADFPIFSALTAVPCQRPCDGLSLTWSQTPEDRFSRDVAHILMSHFLAVVLVESSMRINWTSPFVILGVLGVFVSTFLFRIEIPVNIQCMP